jgi:hypothetical protein
MNALVQTAAALLELDAEVDALSSESKALSVALEAGDRVLEDADAKIDALDERRRALVARLEVLKRGEASLGDDDLDKLRIIINALEHPTLPPGLSSEPVPQRPCLGYLSPSQLLAQRLKRFLPPPQ